MKLAQIVSCTVVLLLAVPAAAQTASRSEDGWQFTVVPYLWVPTIDTTLKFQTPNGNPEVNIKANPGDYVSDLELALLLALEARKGKWLVATDVTYMKLSVPGSAFRTIDFNIGPAGRIPVSAALDAGTQTDIDTTIWTLVGGYNLVQDRKMSLDVIGGMRYLKLDGTVDWRLTTSISGPGGGGAVFPASGSAKQKGDNWDAIVGVKGRARLGEGSWFVPFLLDAGTGDSRYTLQAQTGIGYAFRWGDLVLAYRYLAWKADDDAQPIQELKLYGFGLGGVFRF